MSYRIGKVDGGLVMMWTVRACVSCHALARPDRTMCEWCGYDMGPEFEVIRRPEVAENKTGLVSREHPDTSKRAALEVRPRTGTQRARILDLVESYAHRGLTRDEIADKLRMSPNTVRPRVKELLDGGHLKVSARGGRMSTMDRISQVLVASRYAVTHG